MRKVLIVCFVLTVSLLAPNLRAQLHSFDWTNLQGGKTVCTTYAVTSDQHGNSYYTGTTNGIVNLGGVTIVPHGANDAYVGKLNNAGVLQWAAQVGAQYYAQPSAIALDNAGNVYVTGIMADSGYLAGPNIFLAKFDAKGKLVWRLTSQKTSVTTVAAVGLAVSQSGHSVYLEATSNGDAIFEGLDSVAHNVKSGMYTIRLTSDGFIKWLKVDTASARTLCIDSSENVYIGGGYFGASNSIGGIHISSTKFTVAFGFAASYDSAGKIRWVKGLDSLGPSTLCYGNGYLFGGNQYTSGSGSVVIAVRVPTNGSAVKYLRNTNGGVPGNTVVADGLGYVYMTGQLTNNIVIDTVKSTGGSCYIMRLDTALRPKWVTSWYDATKLANYYPSVAVDTSRGLVISGTIAGQTSFGSKQISVAAATNGFVGQITLQDLSFSLPKNALLCAPDTMSVYVHTQGPFFLANTFDVQLSDSLGKFTSYIRIGQLQANGDCTVLCNIPANLHSGSKYRIRVVASSPVLTTHDNGFDLAMNIAPAAFVMPSGTVDICEDDSVTITAYGGFAYWWETTGDTSKSIVVKSNGKYNVWVFGANGCIAHPQATTVTVHLLPPTPGISQAGNTLYSSSSTNNQWNRNGVPISGATSSSYTPTQSGMYTVTVSNQYKCSVTSDGVDVKLNDAVETTRQAGSASISSSGILRCGEMTGTTRISITNLLGAVVTESQYMAENGLLDLSNTFRQLPSGVYYLRIETERAVFSLRFVHLH